MTNIALVGHNKCATRWLAEVMKSAPGIDYIHWKDLKRDPEASRASLEQQDRPTYVDYPFSIQNPAALQSLASLDPDMVGVLIYREPVSALLSMHNYQRAAYGKHPAGGPNNTLLFAERVRDKDFLQSARSGQLREIFDEIYPYPQNARRLRQQFSSYREIVYERLRADPESVLEELFQTMGAEPDYEIPRHHVNRSLAFRSQRFHDLMMSVLYRTTGIDSKTFQKAYAAGSMDASLVRWLLKRNDKPSHFLTGGEVAQLKETFQPLVQELSSITDLDLQAWGYPDQCTPVTEPPSVVRKAAVAR